MKTTEKDFKLFVNECKKWEKIFELSEWDVGYFHEKLTSKALASTGADKPGMIISVVFSTEWDDFEVKTDEGIKKVAKHEMIHALLGDFAFNARNRYTEEDVLFSSEEALVHKLLKLIT